MNRELGKQCQHLVDWWEKLSLHEKANIILMDIGMYNSIVTCQVVLKELELIETNIKGNISGQESSRTNSEE